MERIDRYTPSRIELHALTYSSNLLTPTWPLCKNILSVDYERSISFRKCNRWKSFEIVHVCLSNKKCYNIQYDYDVGHWRLGRGVSGHCLRSLSRGFEPQQMSFFNYYMVEKAMKNGHVVEISSDKLIINLADESSDSAASHSNSDWFFCKLLVLIISCFLVFTALALLYYQIKLNYN